MSRIIKYVPVLFLVATSCVIGEEPVDPTSESVEPTPSVPVRGQTLDYFSRAAIGEVALETLGLAPEQSAVASLDGTYELSEIPEYSWMFVRTQATDVHAATLTELIMIEAADAIRDVHVVSNADVARQHATAGLAVEPASTMVIVELALASGAPVTGMPRADLSIVDDAGMVVAAEPFVFGSLGDVDPLLVMTEEHQGTSRVAFLNVPPGVHTLSLMCASCEPALELTQMVMATAGVSLSRLTIESVDEPDPTSFEAIITLLARGSDGGLGCANCHTANGPSTLAFDEAPEDVHAALLARGVINVANPDESLLLSKPLYELPANHPNATFLDQSDPSYVQIREWIANGAAN